jgi:hypothetical protein
MSINISIRRSSFAQSKMPGGFRRSSMNLRRACQAGRLDVDMVELFDNDTIAPSLGDAVSNAITKSTAAAQKVT